MPVSSNVYPISDKSGVSDIIFFPHKRVEPERFLKPNHRSDEPIQLMPPVPKIDILGQQLFANGLGLIDYLLIIRVSHVSTLPSRRGRSRFTGCDPFE